MTDAAAYQVVVDAIVGLDVSDDQNGEHDVFSHFEGREEDFPARDRVFVLERTRGPGAHPARGACERQAEFSVIVYYSRTDGMNARALTDGKRIDDVLMGLPGGLAQVEAPFPAEPHPQEHYIFDVRTYRVSWSVY